jgi:hypothetical protein
MVTRPFRVLPRAFSLSEQRLARQLQRIRFADDTREGKLKLERILLPLAGNTGRFGSRLLKYTHVVYAMSMGPVSEGSTAGVDLRYNALGRFLKLPEADLELWEGCETAKYGDNVSDCCESMRYGILTIMCCASSGVPAAVKS